MALASELLGFLVNLWLASPERKKWNDLKSVKVSFLCASECIMHFFETRDNDPSISASI